MRKIEIVWPELDITVQADLDDRNPALADALWQSLPYRSLQGHALVAGHHLFHVAPIHSLLHLPAHHKVDRRLEPDGTVFCSRLQHLGIKYGALTEPMLATPVGLVREEDTARLAEAGRAVWESVYSTKRPVIAEVRRAGEPSGHELPRLTARNPLVDALIGDLYAETKRIWLEPPEELVELHEGRVRSGAGSYETVLTTLLFVNGETRPLGYACYGGLVRAAQTDIPLPALREMARILAATPAEFLGYCGLETLWRFTRRTMDLLDQISERDDYTALMAHMALYVNCLGGWNLHLFPWQIGDHLRPLRSATAATAAANGAVNGATNGARKPAAAKRATAAATAAHGTGNGSANGNGDGNGNGKRNGKRVPGAGERQIA
ncbi:hypothetical protein HNP84_003537 [Thermocatellispora tengchongensis]|uniref:Cucumopine synthase C-terminal helical bundle domain-containing protein n=1 Tax=Thermocatellispora tengchongensis TaxID=1073253 RepID=A0A840P7I0_9ACTN|nr:hypothetical protein [Thermocatellispora tengchongensis]MBB5133811.1 hypothetical protein [Thermocatellispora tengchongensis]